MNIDSSQEKQGRHLINFDGTSYDSQLLPPARRLATQLVTSPGVRLGLLTNFAFAALEICTVTKGDLPQSVAVVAASVATMAGAWMIDRGVMRLISKGRVIDKTKTKPGIPLSLMESIGNGGGGSVIGAHIHAVAAITIGSHFLATPSTQAIGVAAISSLAPHALWHFNAGWKLFWGNWKMQDAPRAPNRPDAAAAKPDQNKPQS